MTHKRSGEWNRYAVVLLLVLLAHVLIFGALARRSSGRQEVQQRVQWIAARHLVASAPAVVGPAGQGARAAKREPVMSSRRSAATAATVVPGAVGTDQPLPPAPPTPPTTPTRSLDLSPETLGKLLDKDRRGDNPRGPPPQSWRASASDTFAPARQSETVGSSGSRVTRVEGPLGTYCIRSPQPGRPQPSGAGLEWALPTNCP